MVAPMKIGILGGTGPAGRGLGLRLAVAGHEVSIGSRDQARAEGIAAELRDRVPGADLELVGRDNPGAADAEMVVVGTPWDSAVATVRSVEELLAGKAVVSMVVALLRQGREMLPLQVARGSMASALQAALPGSRWRPRFHHLPASEMEDLASGLEADVLVCSDYEDARLATIGLVESMEGLRPIDVGSLAQAGTIEAFTATCITVNMRHRVHSTVRLAGF